MTADVKQAVEEVRTSFPNSVVVAEDDGQGGAFVRVEPLDIGEKYVPSKTWCAFHVTFQYPRADVYPHHIGSDVKRGDNSAFGQGVSPQHWRNSPSLQLSRRSNRLDPSIDSAATKLAKVIAWFRSL